LKVKDLTDIPTGFSGQKGRQNPQRTNARFAQKSRRLAQKLLPLAQKTSRRARKRRPLSQFLSNLR
jgi:hypothetical protein